MTRVDLVDAISPNRLGSDKSQWDPNVLSRSKAEEVVNVVFEAIVEALLKAETVDLPIGTFEVQKRKTPTPSGRLLKIEFTPGEWLNEPAGRPERTGPPPVLRKKKIRKFKRYPREEQLKQMLKVAKKWIVDQGFRRDEVIYGLLPDAKKWVDLNRGAFPEYPLRPAALLLKTRPPNLEDYGPGSGPEMFAACTGWFESFLAHCAPRDQSLREEVVNTLIDWAKATLPLPTGIRPWGAERVHTFYQLPGWRP